MQENPRSTFFILFSLWAGHFAVDFMLGIWAIYKTIAELDLAICGLIAGICAFAGEGMQVFFGTLSDRGYRTHLIILGILLSASNVMLAYSDNYFVLFFLMLLSCMGSGAFHPSAASLIHSLSPKNQGVLMSFFQTGGGAGLAISQIIFVYSFYALEGSTLILALPTIGLVLLLLVYQTNLSKGESRAITKKSSLKGFGELFADKNMRRLYISQLCNQSMVWGTLFLLPDVLVSRGYESWISFGAGHFAFVSGMTIFLIPAGYLADKYSLKAVVITTIVLGSLAFYSFLLTPFLSTPMLMGLLVIMGGCLGIVSPLTVVYGHRLAPDRAGMVSAFLMGLVWCFSEGIGQFGGGLLTKLFDNDAPARSLGCLGILFFIGLAANIRLPQPANIEIRTPVSAQ